MSVVLLVLWRLSVPSCLYYIPEKVGMCTLECAFTSFEFNAALVNKASSGIARSTQGIPVLKKILKKRKKENIF